MKRRFPDFKNRLPLAENRSLKISSNLSFQKYNFAAPSDEKMKRGEIHLAGVRNTAVVRKSEIPVCRQAGEINNPKSMKLRTLAVTFDTDLPPWELPKFRGAIAQKVGYEHDWFHNHDNATGGFHHRYPLIQYKIESSREAMRPMLLCVENGVEEAHHFFGQADWSLQIGPRSLPMRIHRLDVKQTVLGVFEQPFTYRIHKWQALNSENYDTWKSFDRLADRYQFLEKTMLHHILAFARGVGWEPEKQIEVRLTDLINQEWISHKDVKKLCFSIEFTSNASLPDFVGMGKGASVGFGVVRRQRARISHSKPTNQG